MTARIFLSGRYVALVDDIDRERVSQYKWFVERGFFYVLSSSTKCPPEWRSLHRLILQAQPGQIVDHRNGNRLDNRRDNLRLCTYAENARNRVVNEHPTKSSKFKGVVRIDTERWLAGITCDGVYEHLGTFGDECDAARAYDVAALEKFKEFALTNEAMGLFVGDSPRKTRRRERDLLRATKEEIKESKTFSLWTRVPDKDRRRNGQITGFAYKTKGGMIFHFPPGIEPERKIIRISSPVKVGRFTGQRPHRKFASRHQIIVPENSVLAKVE